MWKEINIYDRWMFGALLLLAAATNTSTGGASIGICLGALIMLVQGVRMRRFPEVDRGIVIVVVIHTLLWAVASAFSLDPLHSFRELWATTYRFLPLFFAMIYLRAKWQLRWLWIVFALSVFVDDAKALWQYATFQDLGWGHRPTGFNHSPTFLASHMLMAIPVLLFVAGREYMKPMERKFLLVGAVLSFLALIFSGTRGGWLAFLGTAAVYAVCDRTYRRKAILVFSSLILALCLAAACSASFQSRLVTMTDPSYQSNSERLLMWQSAAEIIRDYPVTGIGMDEFAFAYNTKYISPLAKERAKSPEQYWTGHGHPHNNLLKMFSEGGILGFSAFLILHGYFLWRFLCLWRKECHPFPYGLMAILVLTALQLEGLTDTNMIQVPIMREYWLLAGIVLAAGKMEEGTGVNGNG